MDLNEEIVSAARRWIGTPYVHQASCLGAGTDCLGLIRGIWREVYGQEPEAVPAYSPDWAETSGHEALWQAARRHLRPATTARAGQLLLFRMRDNAVAKHLGIASECGTRPRFVHAYSGHGVVENPLSEPWAKRVAARFDFPDRT